MEISGVCGKISSYYIVRHHAAELQTMNSEVFEIPGILASMGEAAITLAGFSAVFRAFSGSDDPDGYSKLRLSIVIEGSLVVALVCYLPIGIVNLGFTGDLAWRFCSTLVALWALSRILLPAIPIARSPNPLPHLFLVAVPQGAFATVLALLNLTGLLPYSAYSIHLLASIFLLSNVATVFVAQFRAESPDDT